MSQLRMQRLKGMPDLLPEECSSWQAFEHRSRQYLQASGFDEIRTPILEPLELFTRSMGETSEVVGKQMFAFEDRGGRQIGLRPEMTASVARAAIENGLLRPQLTHRLYYLGPMFRAEKPQKGRLRQFHQIGCEILNAVAGEADAELLEVAVGFLRFMGLETFRIRCNHLGNPDDRKQYEDTLREYFSEHQDKLSPDSQVRLEKNVLRILDSKAPEDQMLIQNAPEIKLGNEASREYQGILDRLKLAGIEVESEARLVRGLDYYTGFVFEICGCEGLGSQDAVLAGGRYDSLLEELGGKSFPSAGFAAGIERLLLALNHKQRAVSSAYLALMLSGKDLYNAVALLAEQLMQCNIRPVRDSAVAGLSNQLKRAGKRDCTYAIICGEKEWGEGKVIVKDLVKNKQQEILIKELASFF